MKTSSLIIGIIIGILLTAIIGWAMMPSMMLKEYQSPYNVEETAEKIKQNAIASGWVVAGITPLEKSVKEHGGGDLPPVRLINLCQADHAYNILKDDPNKIVFVMMPCTISVYQRADGKAYIGTMNADLLGKMFGGEIARVMGGATQLTLGVDSDSGLLTRFDERNEAVINLMEMAINACKKQGKYVGICGQAPSDFPEITRWLVKHGIDSISLNADSVLSMTKQVLEAEAEI